MISEATKTIILTAINADQTATQDEKDNIIKVIKEINGESTKKGKMITSKEAWKILGVTRRTLFEYEKRGFVHGVRLSQRRVMFHEQEILDLYTKGYEYCFPSNKENK